MKQVSLGSLFADRVGSLDPRSYPDETFELWSIPAFDSGKPDIAEGAIIGSAKKCVEPNDVILSRIIPHIRRAAVVSDNQGRRQIASSEWIIFRSPVFWPAYLKHFLLSDPFHAQFMNTTAGVGGSLVRARPEAVSKILVPLPPIGEQRRIAAILDQADGLRRKRRIALDKLNALPQAIFHEMFGDPVVNSNQWETAYLGALCRLVRGSSPRPQGDARFFGGPVPRLMIADLTRDGMIVFPKIDSLTLEGARRSRPMPAGTVVMAVSGAVGLPAILGMDACIHDGFVGFPDLDERISPLYLYYWLLSQRALNSSRAPGAIWINLTTDQVGKFLIALPPRDVQEAFAMRINSLSPILEKVSLHAKGLDQLLASLQHHAFSGTLTPIPAQATLASIERANPATPLAV